MQLFLKILNGMANSVDSDQTAPSGAAWPGSMLFIYAISSETLRVQNFIGHLPYPLWISPMDYMMCNWQNGKTGQTLIKLLHWSSLIWVQTVCSGPSVQIFWLNTVCNYLCKKSRRKNFSDLSQFTEKLSEKKRFIRDWYQTKSEMED